MRKDIFVVGVRLVGVMQLIGAFTNLAQTIFYWIGYYRPPSFNFQYFFIHIGVDVVVGLYLILRPFQLFHIIELFAENDNENQADNGEGNEESDTQ